MSRSIPEILKHEDHFLVVTHTNPDGDAAGSLLGMRHGLTDLGKTVHMLISEPLPESLRFLPGSDEILTDPATVPRPISWIISVDAAERSRVSADISGFSDAPIINIDHHGTNPLFGDFNHVAPAATSSAELVLEMLKNAGAPINRNTGMCLFTGLLTDTGGFMYSGVTAKTLSLGAEMLAPGIDAYEISRPLYEEYPVSRLHLENLVLTRLDSHFSGQLMLSWLVYEDFVRLGAAISESENLVNKLRQCRGVRIGILITVGPKITRVSLRGKDVNVADIASKFGGGGHRFAAGLKTSIALDDLKRALIIEAGKALNPSGEPIA